MRPRFVDTGVRPPMPTDTQEAVGSIEAQEAITHIQTGLMTPMHAWLRFCELASAHSSKSPACRAFVLELVKRAAGRPQS